MTIYRICAMVSIAAMVALVGCGGDDDPDNNNTVGSVTINGLEWTAENINIETPDSWCCDDKESNCTKYGRLYTYEAAKIACASMGGGWRLPTNDDWDNLVTYAGDASTAGKKLKAKSGWEGNGNGTDDFGFSALPGAYRYFGGIFTVTDYLGCWWSATEYGPNYAHYRYMDSDIDIVDEYVSGRSDGFSVRCVRDEIGKS